MFKCRFDVEKYQDAVDNSFTQNGKTQANSFLMKLAYKYHKIVIAIRVWCEWWILFFKYNDVWKAQYTLHSKEQGFRWLRLLELERLIKKFKPESICEFGPGSSTTMLAKLSPGKITSYEESEYWRDDFIKKGGGFHKGTKLVLAKCIIDEKDGEIVFYYDIDHKQYFDLCYVDGPHPELPEGYKHLQPKVKDSKGVVSDIDVELMFENGIFPKVIVIDGKRATARRIINKGKDRYNVYLRSEFYVGSLIPNFSKRLFHTILVRKDVER